MLGLWEGRTVALGTHADIEHECRRIHADRVSSGCFYLSGLLDVMPLTRPAWLFCFYGAKNLSAMSRTVGQVDFDTCLGARR